MKIHISENGITNEAIGAIFVLAKKANKEMTLENFSILLATLEENGKKWEIEEEGIFRTEKNGKNIFTESVFFDGYHGKLKFIEKEPEDEILEDTEEYLF